MKYGFVIDNRKCIGCHACTVACKTENHVPVGVNRTWVKYVEKGVFPNTRRVFQVTRCNHCEKPPCVTICPVTAMYQRKDGIVDFNADRCIGCKACMQACPYDSIYMDPDDGTAAKCHFCAHRTDVGLEPACVIVCPEHAIIAGDLGDATSEIAQLVAREPVRVRKPEQGTVPKLYYIDGDESAIVPTAARHESIYMWSQRNAASLHGGGAIYPSDSPLLQKNALAAYDVGHARPWGWQVPAYCWTKSIGAGALAVPAIAMAFGKLSGNRVRDIALATVALLFTALTTVLLVWDLEHKERFLRVVFMPQTKSWLARGAFILIAYSSLCGIFWLAAVAGSSFVASALLWPTVLLGFCAAAYTAFLFGQCEGRDLWQTPLLPAHLIVQALLCGSAVLVLLPDKIGGSAQAVAFAIPALMINLGLHLLMLLGEVAMPHTTDNARYGARLMTHGPFARAFWGGAVVAGGIFPLILLLVGPMFAASRVAAGLASVLALAGLLIFEWCFVMAGQSVPNS
jgi:Fe-S-cluster-containing dehydrogenase component/formate-dependent nitrite reductase membrane component NrfD